MLFGKRENVDVQKLFGEHVRLVRETLEQLIVVVDSYLDKSPSVTDDSFRIHELEHEADDVRRRIQSAMAGGAFLPFYREDYILLAELIDKVANRAVEFSKSLILERPRIPDELRDDFRVLAKSVYETFMPFQEVASALFDDPALALTYAEQVSEGEQTSDSIEWKMRKRIYDRADLERAEQMIAARAIQRISDISDAIENAADKVRVIVTKQAV
jgi:predicted phosphate transport protein (TIGR00153 family)